MTGLLVFFLCVLLLIGGYAVYGRIAERVFGGRTDLEMPCKTHGDGVDFVPLPSWKVFMIQLLNIAGLGPVLGAVSGCLFGPVALLWIVFGCILAGAVHDFLSAMLCAHSGGKNLPELIGHWMGPVARHALRITCVVMLVMIGVIFTRTPAEMLANITPLSATAFCVIILVYYFLATILPIQVLIGRLYPFFAAMFLFMAGALLVRLPFCGHEVLPDLHFFTNMHPKGLPVWPMIFVTISCGAISGFHGTQSPMMVRCLQEPRLMRPVFYGAMVTEGLVALIWATVGLTLRSELAGLAPGAAISSASELMLGQVGGIIAVLGVVVLAITSGDTALRVGRLIMADGLHLDQTSVAKRLMLAVPIFAVVIVLFNIDFNILWRYFGWANQGLACLSLWMLTIMLRQRKRPYWLTLIPAMFMTVVCVTYLLCAPECGIHLDVHTSTLIGLGSLALFLILFWCNPRRIFPSVSIPPDLQ